MCAFFCLRWASECSLSSGKEAVLCLWGFARPLFLKYSASSDALLLPHPYHLCPQDLKPSVFCIKLGNYQLFNYSFPSFFCFSPVLHCAFFCTFLFSFCFMYIRTVDKLLLLLKQKTGREENGSGWEGIRACVWTSSTGWIRVWFRS